MKTAGRLPRALRDDLVIRVLEDETLVYDTKRDQAHCLNYAAARVWEFCDGNTTAAQASRALRTELDIRSHAVLVGSFYQGGEVDRANRVG